MELSALLLSRLQFAFTVSFHAAGEPFDGWRYPG
jgi:hypothetical protein